MITSLRMVDFKNFADAILHLGPLTLVIGTNASGKSNIGDAFRFLSRIPGGRNVNQIIGGYRDWAPIRGAMNEIVRLSQNKFRLEVTLDKIIPPYDISVKIDRDRDSNIFRVMAEKLRNCWDLTYNPYKIIELFIEEEFFLNLSSLGRAYHSYMNDANNSAIEKSHYEGINDYLTIYLKNITQIRNFDLYNNSIQEPSISGIVSIGDHGENTATVLRRLHENPETKTILLSWLAEISPMDISDLQFGTNEAGYTYFSLIGNGQTISARSASDGTLRYLAYLAAILDAAPGSTFFFEELDTGIHPTRLHLLLEFMESQAKAKDLRIIVTTHSPLMLDLASDETFGNSSLVYRGADGTGKIKRLKDLPNLKELRQTQGLGRLHASSWFEQAASYIDNPGDAS